MQPLMSRINTILQFPFSKAEIHPLPLPSKRANPNSDLIIFFDEYIGSATQIIKTIDNEIPAWPSSQICVVTQAIHRIGVDTLADRQINVYTEHIDSRGISDHITDPPLRVAALKKITRIGRSIGASTDYLLGFKQCQAMVVTRRIPNNTFPVFWHETQPEDSEHSTKGLWWKPPFPRNW